MSLSSLILIAIPLAMDAFAVSISAGLSRKHIDISLALKLAGTFGIFQAGMTLLGWIGGKSIAGFIEPIDHWVAFFLLVGIGIMMIYEAFSDEEEEEKRDYFSKKSLITLGVATSIDALAVGISLALLPISITTSIFLIGVITLVLSFFGVYLGKKFGSIFAGKAELLGGIILIIIGARILMEHVK